MTDARDGSGVWIFQASPAVFDLRATLRSLRRFSWLVRTHRTEIGSGDRVYLWTAGPNAGVLAVTTVIDRPSLRAPEPALRTFMRDPASLEGIEPRVELHVDGVLDRPILRRDLLTHPVLSDLAIIRARQGTNFRVSAGQAEALADLVAIEWNRSVLVCWQGNHVLSTEWATGYECPLCGEHVVAVRERDLEEVGAMVTIIGTVSPERLARVRREARHLLAFHPPGPTCEETALP